MCMKERYTNLINDVLDLFERFGRYIKRFKNRFYIVNFKGITKYEKEIINKFYNSRLEEYTSESVTLNETEYNDIILKLIERNILKNKTILEKINDYTGYGVNYNLIAKARKKLNKKGGLI